MTLILLSTFALACCIGIFWCGWRIGERRECQRWGAMWAEMAPFKTEAPRRHEWAITANRG